MRGNLGLSPAGDGNMEFLEDLGFIAAMICDSIGDAARPDAVMEVLLGSPGGS
jgi:hypothetical protein